MKVLKKLWVRLIIGILLGAIASALYHYKTGSVSPETGNMILLFVGSIVFSFLSLIVWAVKAWDLFFPKKTGRDDILDE